MTIQIGILQFLSETNIRAEKFELYKLQKK